MADVKLSNIANVTGTYDSVPTTLTSEAVITEMIAGLTIIKSADKQNLATGNLPQLMLNVAVLEKDRQAFVPLYKIMLLGLLILNAEEDVLNKRSGALF